MRRFVSHLRAAPALAIVAGLAAPTLAQRALDQSRGRSIVESPVVIPVTRFMRVTPRGPAIPRPPLIATDSCNVLASLTTGSFSGGTYTLQAGFAEGEIAAVSYTINAAEFPIRINQMEVIVAQEASVATTTQWSVQFYSGTPSTGSLVATYSSDDIALPHIRMPAGTVGTNLQFSIDPMDPEQIDIPNNGSNTFSIAFRIDKHNQPGANPLCSAPPPASNAFLTTDNTVIGCGSGYGQLNFPTQNWLFANNCPLGCQSGWSSFASLPADFFLLGQCFLGCRPRGDWIMRATWSSVLGCTPGVGACCKPDGTCEVLAVAACQQISGTYRGDGTSCATANCPQPSGACCFPGGCITFSQTECAQIPQSTWLGVGTACAGSVCPLGACCLPIGTCVGGISSAACIGQGGVFQGVGSNCGGVSCPQPTGACCLTNGNCLLLTSANCGLISGSVWQGPLTTCGVGQCSTPCYPNCDQSTVAPILNVNDFTCFLNKFAAGDSYANCDQSTVVPVLNVNDFTCFLNKFAAGCT
ncbi:MAG: GC-type dockerin domain-anchored protein [Phycisphaerales bacterium]